LSDIQKVRLLTEDRGVGSNSHLKDETVRTYLFPSTGPHLVLEGHRAAANTVALAGDPWHPPPATGASESGTQKIGIWSGSLRITTTGGTCFVNPDRTANL